MKISLVIPAYNESRRLSPFLSSITKFYQRHQNDLREVIIVDDGSSDNTVEISQSFQRRLPILRIVQHDKNRGKGAAVRTGVLAARGDAIVFMDADGATPIEELPKMITALARGDVAVGNRWLRGAITERHSSLRRLSGWAYRTYMRLFGLGKIDTMCGFKGYRLNAARDLFGTLLSERWLFDTEVAYKAVKRGYHIINFPIRWTSKDGSKLGTFTLLKSAFQIWPLLRKVKKLETSNSSRT